MGGFLKLGISGVFSAEKILFYKFSVLEGFGSKLQLNRLEVQSLKPCTEY